MTDIPTITFECIGCDHSEEIELTPMSTLLAWIVPDPWEADWIRNDDGQLICQSCYAEYPEPEETLSASERNRLLPLDRYWQH
jgi:hypothetical protein